METFATVTPVVEPLSLDEAFLDVSGAIRRLGSPARIGALIRDTIADEQGITCSVGVAPTKFVAKLASGLAKPDGMVVVPADEVIPFIHQLPVGALWGVGDRTEEALARLGLRTVADIAHTPRRDAAPGPSATPPAPTCTTCPGAGTPGRCEAAGPGAEHRGRRDLRDRHRRPRRSSTAGCSGSATGWPPGCGPPGWPAAP